MGGKKPESQLRDLATAFFYLWNKSSAGEKAKKHVFGGTNVAKQAAVAQSVERRLGKAEVTGSIPVSSFFCV